VHLHVKLDEGGSGGGCPPKAGDRVFSVRLPVGCCAVEVHAHPAHYDRFGWELFVVHNRPNSRPTYLISTSIEFRTAFASTNDQSNDDTIIACLLHTEVSRRAEPQKVTGSRLAIYPRCPPIVMADAARMPEALARSSAGTGR